MPLNWLLEAIKWQKLVEKFTVISLKHSFKAVLSGISTGIFTPNRIGEFAGRPYFTDEQHITSGIFAGFAGSIAQSVVTLFMGIVAINLYMLFAHNDFFTGLKYIILLIIFSFLIITVLIYLFYHLDLFLKLKKYLRLFQKYESELNFLSSYSKAELNKILFYAFLRYLIFFMQFFMLLHAFDVEISLNNAFISIALIYLFLFVVPVFAFSEIGIRGSLSVFFIGMYSANYLGIFAASALLWIVNLALPALFGGIILLSKK